MEIGVTVGDPLDRVAQSDPGFPFVELAIGEGDRQVDDIDEKRLDGLLDTDEYDLLVHLPFKQPLGTTVPELDEAIVDHQTRLLEWAEHLHVHDVRRRGDTHLPLRSGEVALPELAAQFDFDGTAAIEVFTDDEELLADTAERTAQAFGQAAKGGAVPASAP